MPTWAVPATLASSPTAPGKSGMALASISLGTSRGSMAMGLTEKSG